MAEAAHQLQPLDSDPDFEPFCRPRSCTWPLPRPESSPAASGAEAEAEPRDLDFMGSLSLALLEETETETEDKKAHGFQRDEAQQQQQQHPALPAAQVQQVPQHHQVQVQPLSSSSSSTSSSSSSSTSSSSSSAQRKSSSCRRNAWGNMSYADLITQAIESSPERRLTLAQIYEWMVKSVPYFKDKGDSNSSAGWKVNTRTRAYAHGETQTPRALEFIIWFCMFPSLLKLETSSQTLFSFFAPKEPLTVKQSPHTPSVHMY